MVNGVLSFEGRTAILRSDSTSSSQRKQDDIDKDFLNHRAMPCDAGSQNLVDRLFPPIVGKDLDLGIARKTLRLDRGAQSFDIDHTVAHHAAVVENVFCGHQPVADVEGQQSLFAASGDLPQHFPVPPAVLYLEPP